MIEISGYLAAVMIGVTLGLIGAGGSILTVPVLVYLMAVEPVLATSYSLFVVGLTALVGSIQYMRQGLVLYRTAVLFSIPAFAGVFLSRALILPSIPDPIVTVGESVMTKDLGVMLLFAVLMVLASVSMIRKKEERPESTQEAARWKIWVDGFVVGILTGLVGAGGGFLIIPALVVLAKVPMKAAVGTSLLIIAVKSLLGFTGDYALEGIDWMFLFMFSIFTVGGIVLGTYCSRFVPGKKLKPAFGWFVLAMGL
ncbi:MAG: sulfite exporter TauE/SafE family protein, partial [Ignavibacteria bacterium]|nr:sulfite exporter TauE/SafE family protein [Ignavibacteria bacterium]